MHPLALSEYDARVIREELAGEYVVCGVLVIEASNQRLGDWKGIAMSEWGLEWLQIASYREEREFKASVGATPEEALSAIEGFLTSGPFETVSKSDASLEVRGPLVEKIGCFPLLMIAIVSFGTLVGWILVIALMLTWPKPRVFVEATREGGVTTLSVKGSPPKAVSKVEQWVKKNS
jgi:hypothetical protein